MVINLKERLSFNQTKTFLIYYLDGLKNIGLIEPLEKFSEKSSDTVLINAVNSLSNNLTKGNSFQNSLKNMDIRFPIPVEFLLIDGFENSYLDISVTEIINNIDDSLSYNQIYTKLSFLVDQKLGSTNSAFICEECFQEEFFKLIQRVKIEKAYKVVLLQEKEDFFIQQFFGTKLVTYKEPSNSKIFQSFKSKIFEASKNQQLSINDQIYQITKIDNNIFSLSSENIEFIIEFSDK